MNHQKAIRYTSDELQEFEQLIRAKITKAKEELDYLKGSITSFHEGDNTTSLGSLDDGSNTLGKEQLNQFAARTQKFILDLEAALFRIKNGTYGVCVNTGKLIPKARLRAVPHTQQSVEAKRNR